MGCMAKYMAEAQGLQGHHIFHFKGQPTEKAGVR